MDVDWQWVAAPAISDELIARARSAAKADPARPELWIALANLLTLLHDNRGALDALLQGIGNAPDDPNLHFLAAQRLRALGEYEQALDECCHALRLKPDHSGARSLRFDLLAKTGRAGEITVTRIHRSARREARMPEAGASPRAPRSTKRDPAT